MPTRTTYIVDLDRQLGPDILRVRDLRNGWPSLCEVRAGDAWIPAAIHVGLVGMSQRGRDHLERRFQNPGKGKPMTAPAGYRPVLIGLQYGGDGRVAAVAGMDPKPRLGRGTRFSMFLPVSGLSAVPEAGWVDYVSASGETIHLFRPELLPVFVAMEDVSLVQPELRDIVEASGALAMVDDEAPERARRAALRAVRRAGFGFRVVEEYRGLCAMCDLNQGLIEGAHIYPVQAPGSPDELWNGLALCPNHHRAFDLHRIFVDPVTLRLAVHPALRDGAKDNAACRSFLEVTRAELRLPPNPLVRPHTEMFERRYDFFGDAYQWRKR